MKITWPVVVALFFFGYACNTATKDKTSTPDSAGIKTDSPAVTQNKKDKLPDTSGEKPILYDSTKEYILAYKTDSLEQQLKLVRRNKETMDLMLILTNTIAKVSDTISGELTYLESGGEESEVADDGSAFSFDTWNYTDKNGCQIAFKIDSDCTCYVRMYDYGCAKALKTPIPVETEHILKRVDIR